MLARCLKSCAGSLAILMSVGTLGVGAGDDVQILTRAEWGAHAPTKPMPASTPTRLTIHHTGTSPNTRSSIEAKLRGLQNFSQSDAKLADGRVKMAWADVPYHYYIDARGAVAEGREAKYIGDSNTSYDLRGHLSVVLEGNFEINPPSDAQIEALTALLTKLAARYDIRPENIGAHRSFVRTACPGRYMMALLPSVRAKVAERLATGR